MKIQINSPDANLNLYIPTGLMCNRLALGTAFSVMHRKYQVPMTAAHAAQFARVLHQFRKPHPDWVLVEVVSADGEQVRITI